MKAVVIGATGATGTELVQKLQEDPEIEKIIIFVRKMPEKNLPKVTAYVVDFNHPESWKHFVFGDIAFSCLGTTLKDAGSKTEQYKVDFTYQFQFAQAARENGIRQFVLVSAYGASGKSLIFYSRMKGKLEEAVRKLNFPKLVIFRPGMLDRKKERRNNETRALKAIRFLHTLGLFKNQQPLPVDKLAQAMINANKKYPEGTTVISGAKIFETAEK